MQFISFLLWNPVHTSQVMLCTDQEFAYIRMTSFMYMLCADQELTPCSLVMPYGERSGLTLAEVMACCLTAPSHYLNQC